MMVKKLTALLIALLMFCTFASADTFDYSGVWYLVSYEAQGMVINPADMGMEMSFTLNADGTGLIVIPDQEDLVATWTADGETITVTAEDTPLTFMLTEDGMLIAEQDNATMTYGREAPAASFVPASEIAAADITEFDGTWSITMVNAFGMVLPFSAMAETGMMDGTVLIQNGSVTSFGSPAAEAGTLTDGKLVIPSPLEDGGLGKTISLLEDGSLSLVFMDMVFYCQKAEAAE